AMVRLGVAIRRGLRPPLALEGIGRRGSILRRDDLARRRDPFLAAAGARSGARDRARRDDGGGQRLERPLTGASPRFLDSFLRDRALGVGPGPGASGSNALAAGAAHSAVGQPA